MMKKLMTGLLAAMLFVLAVQAQAAETTWKDVTKDELTSIKVKY